MRVFIFIFCILEVVSLRAQNLMRPPLNGRLELTGSFAEFRQNHYHSGIDYRTYNLADRRVFSVESGYIQRIRVYPSGYGRAVYISHPNGMTSVYGHLDSFSPRIDSIVRNIQYDLQSFTIDTSFNVNEFSIGKGEVLGIAGNSGYSFGEHLHFELRDTETDDPINPYPLFLEVYDTVSPQIQWVKVSYNRNKDDVFMSDTLLDLRRRPTTTSPLIKVSEPFALGLGIVDYSVRGGGSLIPYSISVSMDGKLLWKTEFDRYSFDETLLCRASFDFAEFKKSRRELINTYSPHQEKLPFFPVSIPDGLFYLNDDKVHEIKIVAIDYGGNETTRILNIKRKENKMSETSFTSLVNVDSNYQYSEKGISVSLSAGSLCESIYMSGGFVRFFASGQAFQIGSENVGLAKPITISIKNNSIKTLLIRESAGKIEESVSPNIEEDGTSYYEISQCGFYRIYKDTLSPEWIKSNIPSNKNIGRLNALVIVVKDMSKKISRFSATMNHQWVLMEYDLKSDSFTINRRDWPKTSNILLQLEFEDVAGNVLSKTLELIVQ